MRHPVIGRITNVPPQSQEIPEAYANVMLKPVPAAGAPRMHRQVIVQICIQHQVTRLPTRIPPPPLSQSQEIPEAYANVMLKPVPAAGAPVTATPAVTAKQEATIAPSTIVRLGNMLGPESVSVGGTRAGRI
jgi:hypothetical protein